MKTIPTLAILTLLAAPAVQAQETKAPAELYLRICSVCHGEKGDGYSHAQTALKSRPRNFTTEEARTNLTREYMIAIVRDGRPHTPMVGRSARLSQAEIEGVVDFIRSAFIPPEPGTRLGKGAELYKPKCEACHGPRGHGAAAAPAISRARARAGLDEAAMLAALAREPHAPGASLGLSEDERRAVTAYVQAVFIEASGARRSAGGR